MGHIGDAWSWGADTFAVHPLYNLALTGPHVCLHNSILMFQSINEMLDIFLSHIFDTKVIHRKGELNEVCNMLQETWREFGLVVAMEG
jgi:hypothetical protein